VLVVWFVANVVVVAREVPNTVAVATVVA